MDFTYINDNNIKVSLTKNDLERGGVDVDTLDYKTPCSRRFIREILERAYEETGFDADGSPVYVRVFLSADGGCELFISKKKSEAYAGGKGTYRGFVLKAFDTEALIQVCKRLKASGYRGTSELFFEKGEFILKCDSVRRMPSYISPSIACEKAPDFSFVSEYGSFLHLTEEVYAYLCEHCERVCSEKAVEKLSL